MIVERVSFMTATTKVRITPVKLQEINERVKMVNNTTNIIWIHWIHRHWRRGFISTQPAATGPRPVPPTAAREYIDIGRLRLEPCERLKRVRRWKTYSWGPHMSAIVPPTITAPVEPNPPARNRAIMTVWMFLDLRRAQWDVLINPFADVNSQSDRQMHENMSNEWANVQRSSSNLFAEWSSNKRENAKAQRVDRKSDRCLKFGAVQVSRHSREAHIIRRCSWTYN